MLPGQFLGPSQLPVLDKSFAIIPATPYRHTARHTAAPYRHSRVSGNPGILAIIPVYLTIIPALSTVIPA